jgi:hypothetical protein
MILSTTMFNFLFGFKINNESNVLNPDFEGSLYVDDFLSHAIIQILCGYLNARFNIGNSKLGKS